MHCRVRHAICLYNICNPRTKKYFCTHNLFMFPFHNYVPFWCYEHTDKQPNLPFQCFNRNIIFCIVRRSTCLYTECIRMCRQSHCRIYAINRDQHWVIIGSYPSNKQEQGLIWMDWKRTRKLCRTCYMQDTDSLEWLKHRVKTGEKQTIGVVHYLGHLVPPDSYWLMSEH